MDKEQFNLRSLTLLSNGGVEATFVTRKETETGNNVREYDITDNVIPHPDLKKPFLNECVDYIFNGLFEKKISQSNTADAKDRVSCHKITIRQKGDNKQIILTGKLSMMGSKMAVNTPLALADKHGLDMNPVIDTLEDEAFQYFYGDKKAQTDIADALS